MDRPSSDYTTNSTASEPRDEVATTSIDKLAADRSKRANQTWHAKLDGAAKRMATDPDHLAAIEARGF